MRLTTCLEQALAVEVADNAGRCGRGESAALLTAADRRPLDAAAVAGAVGTLGDSTLALRQLDLSALELGTGAYSHGYVDMLFRLVIVSVRAREQKKQRRPK